MELIDFDAAFTQALNRWIEQNRGNYKNVDEMEEAAPDVYEHWLHTPADFLSGKTPAEYFDTYSDAQALIDLLKRYLAEDLPVPDPLLSRLSNLDDEDALLRLALDTAAPTEARMLGIELLRELESEKPLVDFIRWQVDRKEDEDLLESALESLCAMGDKAMGPAKIAFQAADDAGKEALLDILSQAPGDDDVVTFAIRRFQACADKRALYAGYLGKLDSDRALEPLLEAAEAKDITYIDFIEIRNAIERLGGEAPYRNFEDDPTYIAVKQLQVR